jgi:hypothetical protein
LTLIAHIVQIIGNIPCGFDRRARGLFSEVPAFLAGIDAHLHLCRRVQSLLRSAQGNRLEWLDLPALFAKFLQPHHDILTVKYFTARVSSTPAEQSKPQRQAVYLRALRHYRPEVEAYFGYF